MYSLCHSFEFYTNSLQNSGKLVLSSNSGDLAARGGARLFNMAMFFSAILSDLTSRSMSFLIDKCSRPTASPTVEETLNSLQRLLLRVQVVVEEAEERLITNQAMLRQLNRLRKEMFRGYHTLDTFRCRAHEDKVKDHHHQAVSPSSTPSSIFSSAKRLRFCSHGASSEQERINQVVACLEITIRDAGELVVFLSGCPRLYRQPYSMYLLLDKCMFGRQMEMERIMGFLLEEGDPIDENPGVLPIIGPGKVGKSTVIEHACNDERIRNHFSQILRFSEDSINDKMTIVSLSDYGVIKHNNPAIGGERILVIIELTGNIDEGVWRKLYSDRNNHIASGSKFIVASRSDTVARLGTTQALRVQFFSQEAYWYFFKVRTFGSTDTEDHPKLASIAMDMAREMNGCFFGASVFSGLFKANFSAHFWSMALASIKEFKRMNLLLFGARCVDLWQVAEPVYVRRVNKTCEYFVILEDYQTGSAQDSAPKMSIRDLFFGRVRPHGRFKVHAWRSHIPPHYSYMLNCEVRRPQRVASRKKRIQG